jgi:Na+-translocating ferredoxin:NAD+ oxidoreductase subunit B
VSLAPPPLPADPGRAAALPAALPADLPDLPLADRLDALLPQTQCTRCGYPDCRSYAQALAAGQARINQCPPGGEEGIRRLAGATGRPVLPLDPAHGVEAPRTVARVDEAWCIGCTLCIKACPVDCIVGAPKRMHTVVESDCTGCELCVPACPVDCIALVPVTGELTGWAAWGPEQATRARQQYLHTRERRAREARENDERLAAKASAKLADLARHSQITEPDALARKRAIVEAAMARARAQRAAAPATPGTGNAAPPAPHTPPSPPGDIS